MSTWRQSSFLRHALVYGLGNAMLYAASFVLLPLYTRCLGPGEYGTLEVLNRLTEVLCLCLLFGAVRQATITFYRQADDACQQRFVQGAMLVALGSAIGLGALVLMVAPGPVCTSLKLSSCHLLQLAGYSALAEAAFVVLLGLMQARMASTLFVWINVSQLLVRIGLAVLLVWGLDRGVQGVLEACLVTGTLYSVGLVVHVVVKGRPAVSWSVVAKFGRFCLPFLPGGLCLFVLSSGDRLLLLHWAGTDAVGAYALSYKLAMAVGAFASSPLHQVWGAKMYDAALQPDSAAVFGTVVTRILGVHAAVGLGVCLFQEEIVTLLGGGQYAEATGVLAPIVLAYWILAGCCLMDAGFYIRRRTGLKTWINLAAAAVVGVLYVILIPSFGIYGAAYATVGGFAFQALLTRVVAQRLFPVAYQDQRLLWIVGLAAAVWCLSRALPAATWAVPARGALWLLWAGLLWVTGVISPEEKRWIVLMVQPVLSRLGALPSDGAEIGRKPAQGGQGGVFAPPAKYQGV